MKYEALVELVQAGQVVDVENINNLDPWVFIERNKELFTDLIVEDDWLQAGVFWIYNPKFRKVA